MKFFKTIRLTFFIGCAVLALLSCNREEEPEPSVVGYNYFPLETGDYRVYKIQQTDYNSTDDSTFQYYVKEVISESFQEGGQTVYRLDRYYRYTENGSWSLDSVWTARRTEDQAIRTENQVEKLKLVFPLREGMTWDGNRLNTAPYDEYTLHGLGYKDTLTQFQFNDALTVIQSDYQDLISTDKRKEVYADKIGLIYKKKRVLSHQDLSNTDTTGVSFIQTLIDYGP